MFITAKNKTLQRNDTIFFPDTSVKLSNSENVYLITDEALTSLSASFLANDEQSKDFELYELERSTYTVRVAISSASVQVMIVNGYTFTSSSFPSPSLTASALAASMLASGDFLSVTSSADLITAIPKQSGSNPDIAIESNVNTSYLGYTFTTVAETATELLSITDEQTLSNTDVFERSGKFCYKLNLLFTPEYEAGIHDQTYSRKHTGQLNVTYEVGGETIEFSVQTIGRAIEIDGRLTVALQNFKKFINDDYYQAFFESDLNTNEQDQVLLNKKKREYLLVMFELTGFVGSYRSLIGALEYFGWGELLTIKEYWRSMSSDEYKLTDIKNQILSKIDKQLAGYRKSNQMSLTYKVNNFQGDYDSDGLPIYVNVLTDTDTVITKLYALKRVLEEDFLTLNTKIIDITGEISAVVGHELNVWINSSTLTEIRMSENIDSEVTYEILDNTINISEHQVLIDEFAFEVTDNTPGSETLDFVNGATSATNTEIFVDVKELLDDDSVSADFDIATKYYRNDFGLIELDIEYDQTLYQSFRYVLNDFDDGTELYISPQRPIAELGTGVKVAVHQVGRFSMILVLFDHYGGTTIIAPPELIAIQNQPVNFKIAKHDTSGSHKDLRLLSTFEDRDFTDDVDRSFVVDAISESLDVNTYNQLTNDPTLAILKRYETIFDIDSVYTQARQLNGIAANQLNDIPSNVWGYKYGTIIIDLIGDSNIVGDRYLKMKLFEHHAFSEVIASFDAGDYDDDVQFVHHFINLLNNQPTDSIFRKFTYDVNWYSNDPAALITEVRPMLRVKAIDMSFTIDKFFYEVDEITYALPDFPEVHEAADVRVFSVIDTMNSLRHNSTGIGTAWTITVGEHTFTSSGAIAFADVYELEATIRMWIVTNDVPYISLWINDWDESLVISCQADFYFKHPQFGTSLDVFRGNKGTKIITVQDGADIKLAEPIYAFLDTETKLHSANVVWTLRNALTNDVVVQQYAQAFRYVVVREGSYTLECESTDIYGTSTKTKPGVYLVTAS